MAILRLFVKILLMPIVLVLIAIKWLYSYNSVVFKVQNKELRIYP